MTMLDVVAIALKATPYGEADQVVTLYTAQHGPLRAMAKGVKKSGSKLAGACEPLTLNRVSLAAGKSSLYTLCQYERFESFPNLRNDLERLGAASICTDLLKLLGRENDPDSPTLFTLLAETLYQLNDTSLSWVAGSIQFHLQLLAHAGYQPLLNQCVRCDKTLNLETKPYYAFSPLLGGTLCPQCRVGIGDTRSVNISSPTLALFAHPGDETYAGQAYKAHRFLAWYWQQRLETEVKSFDFLFQLLDAAPALT